jgi:alpha-L-fucosidase
LELGAFVHFGIRTFHEGNRDFDGKKMDVSRFQPTVLCALPA